MCAVFGSVSSKFQIISNETSERLYKVFKLLKKVLNFLNYEG